MFLWLYRSLSFLFLSLSLSLSLSYTYKHAHIIIRVLQTPKPSPNSPMIYQSAANDVSSKIVNFYFNWTWLKISGICFCNLVKNVWQNNGINCVTFSALLRNMILRMDTSDKKKVDITNKIYKYINGDINSISSQDLIRNGKIL